MGTSIEPEFDTPPTSEQLQGWARTRLVGQRRYVWSGVLRFSVCFLAIWILAKVVADWLSIKDFDLVSGIPLLPIGPFVGWIAFRERWKRNEMLCAEATKSSGDTPHR